MRSFLVATSFFCFLVANIFANGEPFDFGRFLFGTGSSRDDATDVGHPKHDDLSPRTLSNSSEIDVASSSPSPLNRTVPEIVANSNVSSAEEILDTSTRNASEEMVTMIPTSSPRESSTRASSTAASRSTSSPSPGLVTSATAILRNWTTVTPAVTSQNDSTTRPPDQEMEEVVLGTVPSVSEKPLPKTIFQKTLDWMEDAYTLSILIPITAGVLFATAIILTVACCRCIRRSCRRRRFKRKVLPETVKNLRPSDRASSRLLAESSDEEF